MKTSYFDFEFWPLSYGRYRVSYTSPVTGKQWTAVVEDMTLIDATRNTDFPKQKDLEALKRFIKTNGGTR